MTNKHRENVQSECMISIIVLNGFFSSVTDSADFDGYNDNYHITVSLCMFLWLVVLHVTVVAQSLKQWTVIHSLTLMCLAVTCH